MLGAWGEYCGYNLESDEDLFMNIHYDANGWPCIGKYIGLLIDGEEPIFQTPEEQAYYKTQEFQHKIFMARMMTNAYAHKCGWRKK